MRCGTRSRKPAVAGVGDVCTLQIPAPPVLPSLPPPRAADVPVAELLGTTGLFACMWSALQGLPLELSTLQAAHWGTATVLPFLGFAACMFCFYRWGLRRGPGGGPPAGPANAHSSHMPRRWAQKCRSCVACARPRPPAACAGSEPCPALPCSLVPVELTWGGAALLNVSLLASDLWAALARYFFFGGCRRGHRAFGAVLGIAGLGWAELSQACGYEGACVHARLLLLTGRSAPRHHPLRRRIPVSELLAATSA